MSESLLVHPQEPSPTTNHVILEFVYVLFDKVTFALRGMAAVTPARARPARAAREKRMTAERI